jgi:bifunctional non-homologous end joining protein LigD
MGEAASGQSGGVRLDSAGAAPIFAPMSVTRVLRRRSRTVWRLRPIQPCLLRPAKQPPAGPGWIHEIKHDGFRIIARRKGNAVRLFTRNGYDFTPRFPKIVDAVASLPARSCVVDREAIVVDERGLSVFEALRYRLRDHAAVLCAPSI